MEASLLGESLFVEGNIVIKKNTKVVKLEFSYNLKSDDNNNDELCEEMKKESFSLNSARE